MLKLPCMQWWPGVLSLRDLSADLFGTTAALTALIVVESIWGRPSGQRPTLLGTTHTTSHAALSLVPSTLQGIPDCRKLMALVPFRVSGAAADQTLEHRLFIIGPYTIRVDQDAHKSASLQDVGAGSKPFDAHSGNCSCRMLCYTAYTG